MKKIACILTPKGSLFLVAMLMVGCVTGEGEAEETLYKSGFTDVKITGLSPWSCSKDDLMGQGFVAKNATGMRVSGTVCCGVFKGCTVRF